MARQAASWRSALGEQRRCRRPRRCARPGTWWPSGRPRPPRARSGRHRYGVATVLSTTRGTPRRAPTSARAGQVGDGHGRVGDRLGVDGPGGGAQGGPDGGRVAGVDEADLDAEAGGGVGQQRVAPAVQVALGDHVVAGPGQRQQHGGDGPHARGGGQALGGALQVGDGRLQGGGGRVLVAGVDVALAGLAQGVGVVLGVVEDEGRGLPDRGGQGRLGRHGEAAGVDRAGGEAVSHRCSSHAGRRAGYQPGARARLLGAVGAGGGPGAGQDPGPEAVALGRAADPADHPVPPSRATSRVRRPDTSTADSWS